mgnify:CR=1 FL=1
MRGMTAGAAVRLRVGEKRILPYLKQRGIAALDAVVVTHPDADHTNGILELLELIREQKTALRIRHLFLPVWMKGSEKENPFILAAQKAGIMVEYLKKGDEIRAGELTVSVLHPGAGEDYTGEERRKCCITAFLRCLPRTSDGRSGGKRRRRGPGSGRAVPDFKGGAPRLEKFNERGISEPHTAADQPDFLRVAGTYGHPHRELLERLRACKSHIYGTPVDGAVTVQLKRDRLAVHGYRSDVEFPVS